MGPRALWLDFGYLLLFLTPAGLAPADLQRAAWALSLTYKFHTSEEKKDVEHFRTGLSSGRKIMFDTDFLVGKR